MWRKSENSNEIKPLETEETLNTVYVRKNFVFIEKTEDRAAHWTYEEIEYDKELYHLYKMIETQENTIAEQDELLAMLLLGE